MQKVLYGVGGLFALLLVIGFTLPGKSRFVVSAEIDAHPATVFALLNDMRRSHLWSPVAEVDPNARVVFSGPMRGVGSTVTWDGAISGSGTQTITVSRPYEYVETAINSGEAGESRTWFEVSGGGGRTLVNWGFEHDYGLNIVGRYFGLMVTGVIRRDYEQAIARLEELAESLPSTDFSDIEMERLVVESTQIAFRPTSSTPDAASISDAMGDAYFVILNFIDEHGLTESGAPLAITRSFSGAELHFDAAIPVRGVTDATPRDDSDVRIGETYAGTVLRVQHVGPYRTLGTTHRKITAYLEVVGVERAGDPWESYVSDPTEVAEDQLLTYVYYPIRDL